ncbi:4321_t:CDS:2 [Paraglomus occultum]|uniref:4321_t:CDS:1 n=1 Tax=Paraglomus occultum TaxID=144539 RepID=A0A9N9A7R7_9GLOM|nr:4321_t:CDS:2 [Paraglomus occultum]
MPVFPASFQKFLKENEIDPAVYEIKDLPRYIRINPRDQNPIDRNELEFQLGTTLYSVSGLDGFFRLDGNAKIVGCQAYKDGKIYGIDLSSAIAVYALDLEKGDHVLDLCCAPGAKLCMISDLLGTDGTGTVTGYRIGRARLFVADGTTFGVRAPSFLDPLRQETMRSSSRNWFGEELSEDLTILAVDNGSGTSIIKPFWAPKTLRTDPQKADDKYLYDKVLVDAECTHDGSVTHILKYEKWGWDVFEKNFMNPDRTESLRDLQRQLIVNGWSLLKPGGILVYSTCSLSRQQNEDVIGWFLSKYSDARLEEVPLTPQLRTAKIRRSQYDIDLSMTVRLDPICSNTSGFFVAKIRKPVV